MDKALAVELSEYLLPGLLETAAARKRAAERAAALEAAPRKRSSRLQVKGVSELPLTEVLLARGFNASHEANRRCAS